MITFHEIIGHEDIKRHLQNAIQSGRIANAYIINGETGAGKNTIASAFAAALQCEKKGDEPCMVCDSCKKAMADNHPDIITITHEKENVITIDEIRTQLVNDAAIRPYTGPWKIYLVPDAQLMNIAAQNALLKTIEEPPAYVVVLLLTNNAQALLPTIQSRCVRLDLKPVSDELVRKYLMEHLHIPDYEAAVDTSFAQGNIGRAKDAASSQEFSEMNEQALAILRNLDHMDVEELTEAVKKLSSDKKVIQDYLEIFQFWFRDVLLYKATREIDNLVFKQEMGAIREQARERSYENLEKIQEALDRTRMRLLANVNVELSLELLFLTIRER